MNTTTPSGSRLRLFVTLSLLVISVYSIFVRTQYNTRNTRAQTTACPTTSTNTYTSWDIDNNSANDNREPTQHADKNIQFRGFTNTTGSSQLIQHNEAIDVKSPQLSTLFDALPSPGGVYQVYDWNWTTNARANTLNGITMIGLQAPASAVVRVPDAQFDLIQGTATSGGYTAIVLFANQDSLTLKYTLQDDIISHYTVHLDGICTDPNLLAQYNQLDSVRLPGTTVRDRLPILKGKDPIGTVPAAGTEVKVAVRNSGQFIDPRWINSWWRGITALPAAAAPPTATNGPPACTVPPNAPIITNPAGAQVPAGNFTITWNPSATATHYALRIDDESNGWLNNCAVTQNAGDICIDNLTTNSYSYTFVAGRRYTIWLHALNSCGGYQNASHISVDAVPPTQITPTTAICNGAPPPVQIVSPSNSTIVAGSYEVAWTASVCPATYYVRIDDLSNPWTNQMPCNPSQTQPGDACIDNLSATTMGQFNFVQGHTYKIWVHAVDNNQGWNIVGRKTVTVVAPGPGTNECIIQGFKVPDFAGNPGSEYWTYKPEIANAPIQVTGANVVFAPGANISVENPYFIRVPGNNSYTVTVQAPPGYAISTTSCINQTSCHTITNASLQSGTTRQNVFCPAGGWHDLWWHFTPLATPTPTCSIAGKPVAGVMSRVDNQLTADPTDDQIYFSWNPASGNPQPSDRYHIWLKDNPLDVWQDQGFIAANIYSKIADKVQTVGIQITAVTSCGESEPIEIWSTVQGQPTPTPGPPAPTACLGVQHCTSGPNGTTMFEYCGACSGGGCDAGYTCRNANMTCQTYPNKVFYFDTVYQIPCSLLSPTAVPPSPTATTVPGTGPTFPPSRSRAIAVAAAGALIGIVIIAALMIGI